MAEQQPSILIGILTAVRGDGMEARAVEEFTTETPVLTIGDEQMLAASIGSYVVIRQANIAVLAMVFKMREEDRFEQGKRLSDRFFSLIPVGELKADETFIPPCRSSKIRLLLGMALIVRWIKLVTVHDLPDPVCPTIAKCRLNSARGSRLK
jgi:hypothetical protein